MNLLQWAIKWGIPYHAIEDFKHVVGVDASGVAAKDGLTEAGLQSRIELEASRKGARLWRNNVGAFKDDSGRWVRYGLCNKTPQMNKRIKSSDLIGIKPVVIKPEMVGHTIGQFLAREVKESTWRYSGTAHEQAQEKFINLVLSLGGDAAFANAEGTIDEGI